MNSQAKLLADFWNRLNSDDPSDRDHRLQFSSIGAFKDCIEHLEDFEHVVIQYADLDDTVLPTVINRIIGPSNPMSCLLISSKELSHFNALTLLRQSNSSPSLALIPLTFFGILDALCQILHTSVVKVTGEHQFFPVFFIL